MRLVQEPALGADGLGNFTIVWLQDTSRYDSGQTAGGPRNPTLYASRYAGGAWSDITPIGLRDAAERVFDMSSTGRAALISNPMDMSGVPWLREIRANDFNPWHPARHNLRRLIHEPAIAGK